MPYHVRITSKDPQRRSHDALALDKNADWIEKHIVAPRGQGRDIFIDGQVFSWDSIDEIHITETDQTSEQLIPQVRAQRRGDGIVTSIPDRWFVARDGREVTEQFITGPPGTGPAAESKEATIFATNRKAVMVIYGHDIEAKNALFDWLRAIGLQPREWSQLVQASGSGSPYIGQVLDRAFEITQAVVALFTPDEYVIARTAAREDQNAWRLQTRPNVLIEAGMALVTHPTRTVIAVLGTQELASDLAGRHYIRLSHTAVEPLHDLAGRLHDAGCDTDLTGTDWLNPTRFPDRDNAAPAPPARPGVTGQGHVIEKDARQPHQGNDSMPPPESASLSTMSGDGLYVVGHDIRPGMYRTAGPADGGRGVCYYALLASTNTSDIIDNGTVRGPVTITVGPEVKAVLHNGYKPWHRLDP